MSWSWKLGRWAGTDVKVHFTFVLFLVWVALTSLAQGGLGAAIMGTVFVVLVFGCVLLHEFGHALAARLFGIRTPDITLLPIGGVARLERMPRKPVQELIVAVAGPAVNVAIAAGLFFVLGAGSMFIGIDQLASPGTELLARLAAINVWLVLFNLIPAFPMDGGRVLRAILAMFMGHRRATGIAATLGKGLAIVFGIVGLFTSGMLMFIGVFIYFAAAQEKRAAEQEEFLESNGFGEASPFSGGPIHPTTPGDGQVKMYDETGRFVGWVNPRRPAGNIFVNWRR